MIEIFFPDACMSPPKYSVIAARYRGRWLWCRKRGSKTFEIPGGHIEPGESPVAAARRELYEETGAVSYQLTSLSPYAVRDGAEVVYGMLYFAEVESLGPLPAYEMAAVRPLTEIPARLSYPQLQPVLLNAVRSLITS